MTVHLNKDGEIRGPFTADELATLLQEGQVDSSDSASLDGGETWASLGELVKIVSPLATNAAAVTDTTDPAIEQAVSRLWGISSISVFLLGVLAFLAAIGVGLAPDLPGFLAFVCYLLGFAYLGLGIAVAKRSLLALRVGFLLFLFDSLIAVSVGLNADGALPLIDWSIRLLLLTGMAAGFVAVKKLTAVELKRETSSSSSNLLDPQNLLNPTTTRNRRRAESQLTAATFAALFLGAINLARGLFDGPSESTALHEEPMFGFIIGALYFLCAFLISKHSAITLLVASIFSLVEFGIVATSVISEGGFYAFLMLALRFVLFCSLAGGIVGLQTLRRLEASPSLASAEGERQEP